MAPVLPLEILQALNRECPCRKVQLRQLITYFNPAFDSPPALVLYGLEHTGKLKAIRSVLEARSIQHALVRSKDTLSQRHLLSKIFAAVATTLGQTDTVEQYDKIDSINALVSGLQDLMRHREKDLVLILDGIDRQRGASVSLLPALARLGHLVPNLSVVMLSNSPRPLVLHKSGVPYIHFPPYSRTDALTLLNESPPNFMPPTTIDTPTTIDENYLKRIYVQFTAAVYDSLIGPTSSTSISSFRATCARLWPRFIWPYVSSQVPPGQAKSWDFARLMIQNRPLFQVDGEETLVPHLRPRKGAWTFEELQATLPSQKSLATSTAASTAANALALLEPPPKPISALPIVLQRKPPLLKHFSTLLLLSSYLASHTHPKLDIILFSRLSTGSKSHKIRRRKLLKSPSKKSLMAGSVPGMPSKTKSSSKSTFDAKLGVARPFTLERASAILRAIHPSGVTAKRRVGDKVYREMAELERLRLVVCVGGSGDEVEERWRVNVGKDIVEDLAKTWGMGVREWEVEA